MGKVLRHELIPLAPQGSGNPPPARDSG
jgi:hypothetical protein